ncbi:hypothetical protein ABZ342_21990 [Amycolatopsis sp. NPDC005961]|uniref:hypothetical protein n=1 Tax=Amycolatopsis sp. NPDC005961 TaxID=3156720 RepID=UPI0033E0E51E
MSVVQAMSLTVTQADVLYVSQQIKRDLGAMQQSYPRIVSWERINTLDLSFSTFLINDAVNTIGLSIEDPAQEHEVFHELRYAISYTGDGSRMGIGGRAITPVPVPSSARLTAWVRWSKHMRELPIDKQRQIIQGTLWGLPSVPGQGGGRTFVGKYSGGQHTGYGTYASGPLSAQAEEYRWRG